MSGIQYTHQPQETRLEIAERKLGLARCFGQPTTSLALQVSFLKVSQCVDNSRVAQVIRNFSDRFLG